MGPSLARSRPGPRPIQTRCRHNQLRVKTCDCLVSVLSSSCSCIVHEICPPVPRVLYVKLYPSVNIIAAHSRPLRLSMWPLAKPQIHANISCHITNEKWSSCWGHGDLWIMPLYIILVQDVRITRETIQRDFRAIPSSMRMERLVQWVIGTWPSNQFEVQLAAAIVSGYFVNESLKKSWI